MTWLITYPGRIVSPPSTPARLHKCMHGCTHAPNYARTPPTHPRTHERQRRMDGWITAQSMASLRSSMTLPSITTTHALRPRQTPWQTSMGHITPLHPSRLRRPHIICSHSRRRPARPLHRLRHGRLHVRLPWSLSPHPRLTESCSGCCDLTPWPSSICHVTRPSLCFVCP